MREETRAAAIELEAGVDSALLRLETRYQQLYAELEAVEAQLRKLRTEADLCPECGGTGERWVHGGIYGELQRRPCVCRTHPSGSPPPD